MRNVHRPRLHQHAHRSAPVPPTPDAAFFRLDTFAVPAAGRAEFLGRVAATHAVLRTQPGFVRDVILERPSGPEVSTVVTLVEWESEDAAAPVAAAIAAAHRAANFDRAEMMERLGIRGDLARYGRVPL